MAFPSKSNVVRSITDDGKGFESGSLSGLSLLLHGFDFHNFFFEIFTKEFVNDFGLFDWDTEPEDVNNVFNFVILDQSSELSYGFPRVFFSLSITFLLGSFLFFTSAEASFLLFFLRFFLVLIHGCKYFNIQLIFKKKFPLFTNQFNQLQLLRFFLKQVIIFILLIVMLQNSNQPSTNVQENPKLPLNLPHNQQESESELYTFIYHYLMDILPQHAFPEPLIPPAYEELCQVYNQIIMEKDVDELICRYANILTKNLHDDLFFTHFTENKFLSVLMTKIRLSKYNSSLVKSAFNCIQYLLKGLKNQEHYIYLLVSLSKEEFITEPYVFPEQEDWAYYAHFLKLLVRSINQGQSDDRGKYLSIFFNRKMQEFPLILKLLKFHNFPDVILQTAVKLCFLQLAKNSSKQLNKYMLNFPFVLFYPAYLFKIGKTMKMLISEKNKMNEEIYEEELIADLKFMEDYITIKQEPYAINMYANSYFNFVGKMLYQQLVKTVDFVLSSGSKDKNGSIKEFLKIVEVIEFCIKVNTIVKIRVGFENMFHKYINIDYLNYLKGKIIKLDSNYWLFDECHDVIRQHSSIIFYNDGKTSPKKKSIFNSLNSYIPKSKSNWFYYEIKKISQILGVQINLNEEINHYQQGQAYDESYISAMGKIQEEKFNKSVISLKQCEEQSLITKHSNPNKMHSLFNNILKTDNEEIIYRYILLLLNLKEGAAENYHHHYKNEEQICDLLFYAKKCTSLSLIAALYRYVKIQPVQIDDSNVKYLPKQGKQGDMLTTYIGTMEAILYYVLKQGWECFVGKIKEIKEVIKDQMNVRESILEKTQFFKDIFRDIDCDILYFVMLRHLFGTKNEECEALITETDQYKETKSKEIKIQCMLNEGEKAYLIMDGQYIKFMNNEDVMISKEPQSVNCFNIYESANNFDLVDKDLEGQSFTVNFAQENTKVYIAEEIKRRKGIAMDIELSLRTMHFPIE